MPRPPALAVLGLLTLATLAASGAAPTDAAAQAPPAPCASENHRAFDFWVGSWEVRRPDGQAVGRNTIERKMGGCVLHEHYTTPRGYEGESLNMYDASRDVWHQTWTDNGGLLLRLEGGIRDGAMVMEGRTVDATGAETLQRITWSVVDGDPDRVRQLWQSSTDGGESWSTAFDGLYVRQAP